ncbi:hypothetical protein [Prevotella fusca]
MIKVHISDIAIGHDKLSGDAFRASLGLFSEPARQHALPRISNETEVINYMGRKQAAETADTRYITAESQVPTLRIGSVVSLYSSFLERIGNISKESLGNFVIIEITHEVSQGCYYKNRFKAIPATIKALPSPKVQKPLAETQMPTVRMPWAACSTVSLERAEARATTARASPHAVAVH